MRIFAIDAGTENSAFVIYETGGGIIDHGIVPNTEMRQVLIGREYDLVSCEMIACYGMPVGASTFVTCLWIGRFMEVARTEFLLVYRKDIKLFLCGSMRAKDANIRQALIDRLGPQGIKSHTWAALAVAVFTAETKTKK